MDRSDPPGAEAFSALYTEWWPVVKREALKVVGDEATAEDVAQTVFARLWHSGGWRSVANEAASAPYFLRAAGREALRLQDRREHLRRLDQRGEIAEPSPGPWKQLAATEVRTAVQEAIPSLPERCAVVMELSLLRHWSGAEIARELGVSTAAVEKQRTRGRRILRRWFDTRGGAEAWVSYFEDGGG